VIVATNLPASGSTAEALRHRQIASIDLSSWVAKGIFADLELNHAGPAVKIGGLICQIVIGKFGEFDTVQERFAKVINFLADKDSRGILHNAWEYLAVERMTLERLLLEDPDRVRARLVLEGVLPNEFVLAEWRSEVSDTQRKVVEVRRMADRLFKYLNGSKEYVDRLLALPDEAVSVAAATRIMGTLFGWTNGKPTYAPNTWRASVERILNYPYLWDMEFVRNPAHVHLVRLLAYYYCRVEGVRWNTTEQMQDALYKFARQMCSVCFIGLFDRSSVASDKVLYDTSGALRRHGPWNARNRPLMRQRIATTFW
jgi:hypothetical protein